MKKFINEASQYVAEYTEGIKLAHPEYVDLLDGDPRLLIRQPKKIDKVAIVTGGGSGHLPVFLGYVGEGMLDGCAVGNVFASPSWMKMYKLIKYCDNGRGVLCLYGNYGGDKLNFGIASERALAEGIRVEQVLVNDDVASAKNFEKEKRRGVAGLVYAYKVAGASAERGDNLDEVAGVAKHMIENTRTIGFALSACTIPDVGEPSFAIDDNTIEVGMGIHGEPGIEKREMMTADEVVTLAFQYINDDMPIRSGDTVSIMINSLGATPLEELYILYRKIHKICTAKKINVFMPHIGHFSTSMEMTGVSITVAKVDEKLMKLLEYPARTPFYTNLNKF